MLHRGYFVALLLFKPFLLSLTSLWVCVPVFLEFSLTQLTAVTGPANHTLTRGVDTSSFARTLVWTVWKSIEKSCKQWMTLQLVMFPLNSANIKNLKYQFLTLSNYVRPCSDLH